MSTPLSISVIESAATWYVDLQHANGQQDIINNHRQWLRAHPDHQRAWRRVEKLQQSLQHLPEGASTTLLQARQSRRQAIKALSILLVTGSLGSTAWHQRETIAAINADLRTATGERRTLTAPDGSQIALNTATSLNINFDHSVRALHLIRGEIMVTTAKSSDKRPFIVHTPQGSVRALGTRFTVFSDAQSTRVNVLEHAVELRPAASLDTPLRVNAGHYSRFSEHSAEPPRELPQYTDAWHQGLLIVSNWPLANFITELARYRRGFLACDDAVSQLRISGAFHLDNTDNILDNLASTLPVRIRHLTRYWVKIESA